MMTVKKGKKTVESLSGPGRRGHFRFKRRPGLRRRRAHRQRERRRGSRRWACSRQWLQSALDCGYRCFCRAHRQSDRTGAQEQRKATAPRSSNQNRGDVGQFLIYRRRRRLPYGDNVPGNNAFTPSSSFREGGGRLWIAEGRIHGRSFHPVLLQPHTRMKRLYGVNPCRRRLHCRSTGAGRRACEIMASVVGAAVAAIDVPDDVIAVGVYCRLSPPCRSHPSRHISFCCLIPRCHGSGVARWDLLR